MKSLQKLAALLGAQVTDEMSEDQAVEALAAGISGLCEKVKASEAAKAGMVSMTDYQTLKTQVSSMETENKKIQARRSVDEGLKSRKVAANMEPWALAFAERDPSGFSDYIKLAPEVIPAPPAGHVPPSVSAPVDTVALSDIQNHVANLLGIDAEKVYGKSKSKGV
jgi:phage I-like protein